MFYLIFIKLKKFSYYDYDTKSIEYTFDYIYDDTLLYQEIRLVGPDDENYQELYTNYESDIQQRIKQVEATREKMKKLEESIKEVNSGYNTMADALKDIKL